MIFGPKPPPMNGAITRTCDSGSPSIAASPLRIGSGACVVSQIVVHAGGAGVGRALEIAHRLERLDLDDHLLGRILGDVPARGDDGRYRLARAAYPVAGARRPCSRNLSEIRPRRRG